MPHPKAEEPPNPQAMASKSSIDLEAATREVARGYELSTQLHSTLRQVIPRGDGRLESACRISRDLQETLASALSILKDGDRGLKKFDPLALEISLPCSGSGSGESTITSTSEAKGLGDGDDKNLKNSRKRSHLTCGTTVTNKIANEGCHCNANEEKKIGQRKLQRNHLHSWRTITSTPFNDGHQWRKYGEKHIINCKMTRCYYRCTHKDDQGCPATKQVQQKDNEEYPPKFVVTYIKQHTCNNKNLNLIQPFVVEPPIPDPCQLSL